MNYGNVTTEKTMTTEEDEEQEEDEIGKLRASLVSEDTLAQYIESSLASGGQPLPLMNKINTSKLEMLLLSYKLNEINAVSFANVVP